MHLSALNREACGAFTISADGPLLIRSGASSKTDPALPDALFLTGSDGQRETYVIPGSSLKGVIRHYLEDNGILGADDAEKLFGSRHAGGRRGRLSLYDAYADMDTVRMIHRPNTSVGGVSQCAKRHSLNNTDTLDRGKFRCSFRVINPTDREIFTLLCALEAMNRHILFLGGRTGKGYGRVSIEQFEMQITEGFTPELTPKLAAGYTDLGEAVSAFRREAAHVS